MKLLTPSLTHDPNTETNYVLVYILAELHQLKLKWNAFRTRLKLCSTERRQVNAFCTYKIFMKIVALHVRHIKAHAQFSERRVSLFFEGISL